MPDSKKYNLDFQPNSYWGPQAVETHVGARVKGELRRQQAISDLEQKHADPEIISESLTDEHRSAAASVHPWLMGGEYLPDLKPNEVEIARVTLQSTMMDVISIRARKTKHRTIYRIVDEYPEYAEENDFQLSKKSSIKPLTLRELIFLMDHGRENGLVGNGRDLHYYESGMPADEVYSFETASSAYYPELSRWYDDVNLEWLLARQREENQQEIEDEYEVRYLQGESEITTPEQEWRDQNKDRLERERAISEHLKSCQWEKVTGHMYAGMGNATRLKKIRSFVEKYLDNNKSLPTGKHLIDDFYVTFSDE